MAEKFIEREKLSKKARRTLDRQNRNTWGPMDPRAKRIESKKAYNRKRFPKADYGDGGSACFLFLRLYACKASSARV